MRLEDMEQDFPKMPDEMRSMVENEVAKQTSGGQLAEKQYHGRRKRLPRKSALILLAAALAAGTMVATGAQLYRLHVEKEGNYGLKTGISYETSEEETSLTMPEEIPVVTVQMNYVPEGMVHGQDEPGKISYEETPYVGGVSMSPVVMDEPTSASALMTDTNVAFSEELTVGGRDAVYLELAGEETLNGDIWFNKRMYVIYPEEWYVLQVRGGSDITKEELLKVVEHTELVPTGETVDMENAWTWSDVAEPETEIQSDEMKMTVSAEEMAQLHSLGDTFAYPTYANTPTEEHAEIDSVTAKVTQVQVADDLSLLGDSPYVDETLALTEEVGEDGRLLPNTIAYVKSGDGVETTDEVIKTEEVAQKLVYVTVEFTNEGEEPLTDVWFIGAFPRLVETDGMYTMYNRTNMSEEGEWDTVTGTGKSEFWGLQFYDVHGNERNNNYIPSLAPGETVEVHMANLVNEDELGYLYLNLAGGAYEISETDLAMGYVDIRQ